MKQIIINLIKTYLKFILIFAIQKPLFMLYHFDLYKDVAASEWFKVIWHGLPIDLSMAGYLMVIPVFFRLVSEWFNGDWYNLVKGLYYMIVSLFISIVFVVDIELYSFWGFRLDSTPLFYMRNTSEAMASISGWQMILVPVTVFIITFATYKFMIQNNKERNFSFTIPERCKDSLVYVLIMGLLFIPIRGGFTVSTMNVGKAYYSSNLVLNHAAINPMFSFVSSLSKNSDLGTQYRYMEDDIANEKYTKLVYNENSSLLTDVIDTVGYQSDTIWIKETPAQLRRRKALNNGKAEPLFSIETTPILENLRTKPLLKIENPNILLIVLESFSGKIIEGLGGEKGIAPTMNRLFDEGIAFTNFYANSFRTDRGLVSILSGFPAQPTTSVMKYPAKAQSLPSISGSLKKSGYEDLSFLYGGDADFTNMRGYFMGAGFDQIICDKNFPISQRMTKWGVRDDLTFAYLTEEFIKEDSLRYKENNKKAPFFKMFLTLSSHEPFDVPTNKFQSPYLNSVAYTDSCLGLFIDEFKKTELWDNTLVILVPDHSMLYPSTINNAEPGRYHIPMIWTGGAVNGSRKIDRFGSQIDIASTLLSQLNIDTEDRKSVV